MITLYVMTGCPYCHKVIEAFDAHAVAYEVKDIAGAAALEELLERGGKRQVPFMIDGDVALYESGDIIAHVLGDAAKGDDTDHGSCTGGVCAV